MTRRIKIFNHFISYQSPIFIIAEAGVNHNGRLDLALRLVDAAVRAGADAVKFQTFKAEDVVTTKAQLAMLRPLELKEKDYAKIIKRCNQRGIIFLSTPHGGFTSVDWLQKLKVPAFKFGSGDLTTLPLLQYAAKFKKPMILGTGMATLAEVQAAVQTIKKAGNKKIIVLHATTNYPCPPQEVNLRAMQTMMQKLNVLVGYSDHTLGTQVPVMAATLGACVIEKHFTLDKTMPGPDHKASLEPAELKMMVQSVRNVFVVLGSPQKAPTKSEASLLKNIRKSLVALASLKTGEIFTAKNLGIKRPGTGLEPKYFNDILGRITKREIKKDELIKLADLI